MQKAKWFNFEVVDACQSKQTGIGISWLGAPIMPIWKPSLREVFSRHEVWILEEKSAETVSILSCSSIAETNWNAIMSPASDSYTDLRIHKRDVATAAL